ERDISNNSSGPIALALRKTVRPNVVFVPIEINGCTPSASDFFRAADFVRRVYPVDGLNLLWRSEVQHFSGDPTTELGASALLRDIWFLNLLTDDPVDDMKWVGMVCDKESIGGQGTFKGWANWVVGASEESWFMRRPSKPFGGDDMAQELAHNLL